MDMKILPETYTDLYVHSAVFVHAFLSITHSAISAASAICPREMSGLADQLPLGLPCAPHLGAGVNVWAGPGASPKGQLTLTVEAVAGARKDLWESQLVLGLVKQTFS